MKIKFLISLFEQIFMAVLVLASGTADASDVVLKNQFDLNPSEAAEARYAIVAWLECDDCQNEELTAVQKLGRIAVPTLSMVLTGGPSPAKLDWLRQQLSQNYEATAANLGARPIPQTLSMSNAEYVTHYLGNYVVRYKVRAATALGRIGGTDARNALKIALSTEQSETVRKAITDALVNAG